MDRVSFRSAKNNYNRCKNCRFCSYTYLGNPYCVDYPMGSFVKLNNICDQYKPTCNFLMSKSIEGKV